MRYCSARTSWVASHCFSILVGDDRTAALALRRLDDDDQMDGAQECRKILCVASQCIAVSRICRDLALQNSGVNKLSNETL